MVQSTTCRSVFVGAKYGGFNDQKASWFSSFQLKGSRMAIPCCSTPSSTSIFLPITCFPSPKNLTPLLVSTKKLSFSLRTSSSTSLQVHCSNINSTSPIDTLRLEPSQPIIFIKGLPASTTEGHLKRTFMQFGEVIQVKIAVYKSTKQSLGYAFVWFENEKFAQDAVNAMDGKFFDGRFISVKIAKPGSCKPTAEETPPLKL